MDFISYARQHHGNINVHMIRQYCYTRNYQTFSNGQRAFRYATIRGQTKLAKLVLEMNQNINISAGNEHAFRHACKGGHLKMAKWLLRIKPDIDRHDQNHFKLHEKI